MSKNQRKTYLRKRVYIIDNNVYNINTRKTLIRRIKNAWFKTDKNVTGKGKSGGST